MQYRGRTQKEIAENIPVIVDAASNTQEITLKTTNKTYTFDRVFGQETTQQHIYDDVVSPILQEMLMGYDNCCINHMRAHMCINFDVINF